jgi:hypothetical protein
MAIDVSLRRGDKCWPPARRWRCGLAALGLVGSSASYAALVYNYTGGALTYFPPPSFPTQTSPFGDFVFGTVAFDEAVIVPGFTGTVSSGFTGTFATSSLAARSIGANAAQAPTFTFLNGTLVAWNLRTDFTLLPGIANYLVPLFTANGNDSFSPINGGQVLGRASAAGGSWILQSVPAPVPLPQSGLLLAAGMAWLATRLKAVRRSDELAKQAT